MILSPWIMEVLTCKDSCLLAHILFELLEMHVGKSCEGRNNIIQEVKVGRRGGTVGDGDFCSNG